MENIESDETQKTDDDLPEEEKKSFLRVIVHSFFIIPFLIAVACVLLFTGIHLLTREKSSAYDYLEDVKTGGLNKRWQGAFELSKILSNSDLLPDDNRFSSELISAFEHSQHDDNRVRQYLALAMGRTGRGEFVPTLLDALEMEKEEELPAIIYALGMLSDRKTAPNLYKFADHPNARIRSLTVAALGSIGNKDAIPVLKKGLNDPEANVQWGASLSLANLNDASGIDTLLKLMDRNYLSQFDEVDQQEQTHLILTAIKMSDQLNDRTLRKQIKILAASDQNMKVRAAALNVIKQ